MHKRSGLWETIQVHLGRVRPKVRNLKDASYLTKWLVVSSLIGAVAGVGAIAFTLAITWATHLFLGILVDYQPPNPQGEGGGGNLAPLLDVGEHPLFLLLPLVVGLGGLLSGLLVFTFAPEAEGHGTDAAIAAFHYEEGRVRARIPFIKLVASALTIGSGGSGGREGPTAQISAGFGSLLARWMGLSVADRRIALAAGIGAGIGAIFRAPLGGALIGAEILYAQDLEIEAIIPALIASIIGYAIYGTWAGWGPIFGNQAQDTFNSPVQLIYYALLGVLCGGIGILYARTFHGTAKLFHRLKLARHWLWIKPTLGGILVGLMGLAIPEALGMGYGWVQAGMGPMLLTLPLWLVLALPFAKILSTSLSIGSGGSGGIFGPGMVIGCMVGASVWRVSFQHLPAIPDTPAPFVIVAMMALFGGIAHAPLAVMLMVAEMTGNLSLLAPAMVAVGLASIVVGRHTIYTSQLETRANSPAHRLRLSFPLLSTLVAREALLPLASQPITPETPVEQVEAKITAEHHGGVIVRKPDNTLAGVATLTDVGRVPDPLRPHTAINTVMTRDPVTIHADEPLDEVLAHLTKAGIRWAPVLEEGTHGAPPRPLGSVSVASIMDTYQRAVAQGTRRMRSLVEGTVLVEVTVTPESLLAGKTLKQLRFPTQTLVVAIRRGGALIFPHGETELHSGDAVTFLTNPAVEPQLRAYLAGPEAAHVIASSQAVSDGESGENDTQTPSVSPRHRRWHPLLSSLRRQRISPHADKTARSNGTHPLAQEQHLSSEEQEENVAEHQRQRPGTFSQ
ncbi:MAG TPA: chloride channel protein [Ktedonobacterales bacterium]|jgi:CIC family chloride channel protein